MTLDGNLFGYVVNKASHLTWAPIVHLHFKMHKDLVLHHSIVDLVYQKKVFSSCFNQARREDFCFNAEVFSSALKHDA